MPSFWGCFLGSPSSPVIYSSAVGTFVKLKMTENASGPRKVSEGARLLVVQRTINTDVGLLETLFFSSVNFPR